MLVHPGVSSRDCFRKGADDASSFVERARRIEGVVAACRDFHARQDPSRIDSMNRRGDARNDLPWANVSLSAISQIEREPRYGVGDEYGSPVDANSSRMLSDAKHLLLREDRDLREDIRLAYGAFVCARWRVSSRHERDEDVVAHLGYERIARNAAAEVLYEPDARSILPSCDRQGGFRDRPIRLIIPTPRAERHG